MFICDISVFNRFGKQRLDEMLRPMNLDWRMLVALLIIGEAPGISQMRLDVFLQTDKANITKLLQAMETRDLIRREPDPEDKRNKACYLTRRGKLAAPRLEKILEEWESYCFKGISPEDLARFRNVNRTITQNLIYDWSGKKEEALHNG